MKKKKVKRFYLTTVSLSYGLDTGPSLALDEDMTACVHVCVREKKKQV